MGTISETTEKITTIGKSWVIKLPKRFTERNKLASGTQVLLTVKNGSIIEAEMLPPLTTDRLAIANRILKKRKSAYDKLKKLGYYHW